MAQKITIEFNNITVKEALQQLEKKVSGSTFSYNNNLKELHKNIKKSYKNKTVNEILDDLLKPEKLAYKKVGNTIIIYVHSKENKQKNKTISGYVYDEKSGEILIGATIFSAETNKGTSTNNYGFYSLSLPQNANAIWVSYIGYKDQVITLTTSQRQDVYLAIDNTELEEVIISGSKKTLRKKYAGALNITPKEIKQMPLLLGEPDVLKAVQLQNGIRTVSDGASNYYVRGGNFDQNLVLVDEAPLYHSSHMLGMVSVVNGDVLKNTSFYKGYFPAKYSGRLASVLDIRTKDGNNKNLQLSGGVSTLGARLAVEGPLVKDKVSYIVSARKGWVGLLMEKAQVGMVPNYHDVNTKINWKINPNNNVFASVYYGKDTYINKEINFKANLTNSLATLRWNHIYNEKLFANTALIYNNFDGGLQLSKNADTWKTNINEIRLKHQLSYYINDKNTVDAGIKLGYHQFQSGKYENADINFGTKKLQSTNVFATHKTKINDQLKIEYGVNFNVTNALGDIKLIDLDTNYNITNTYQSGKGVYKTWAGIEPRANISYQINKHHKTFASYSKMQQFVHSPYPYQNDYDMLKTWIPVSNNVKPMKSNIYSLGYNFSHKKIGINIEGYYKDIKNQLDYSPFPDVLNQNYEQYFRAGNATSYGIELSVGYKTEKINIKADYSYSKTTMKTEGVNNGEKYVARYDIPHQLNITGVYNFTKRFNVSAFWTYRTGKPYTLPVGTQLLNGGTTVVPLYGEKHNARFTDYHKLDVMFTLKPKKKTGLRGTWTAGITNAYGRLNPAYINFNYEQINIAPQGNNIFRFFPILSYSFKF